MIQIPKKGEKMLTHPGINKENETKEETFKLNGPRAQNCCSDRYHNQISTKAAFGVFLHM